MPFLRFSFAIVFLLVITFLPAQARMGETEAQTIARYGKPTAVHNAGDPDFPYRTLRFEKGGILILADFIDGKCEQTSFKKADGSALSDDEVKTLMQADSDGLLWRESDVVTNDKVWDRVDGAIARYDVAQDALSLCSAKYISVERARRSAVAKAKLNGF